jgi:hypothetical protein
MITYLSWFFVADKNVVLSNLSAEKLQKNRIRHLFYYFSAEFHGFGTALANVTLLKLRPVRKAVEHNECLLVSWLQISNEVPKIILEIMCEIHFSPSIDIDRYPPHTIVYHACECTSDEPATIPPVPRS